jgi:quercetin dioxygenase-like cupin family protein
MQYERGRTEDAVLKGTEVGQTTGDVLLDKIIGAEGINVWNGNFKPLARTFWHHHEGGQLFFIQAGKGMVATRGGEKQVVQAGDVVYSPPGEEHWHGAAPDCFVIYKAVALGPTTHIVEVSDAEYDATWSDPIDSDAGD